MWITNGASLPSSNTSPLEVAQWLQACHDAGMEVRVQVNESVTP
ncbi:hypothetical protein [Escherichia coli]|nr:hypothetical protein [Escherichia coli]